MKAKAKIDAVRMPCRRVMIHNWSNGRARQIPRMNPRGWKENQGRADQELLKRRALPALCALTD